jgi:3-oxoacyl-[acyl-carrier protein] reductase
MKANEKRLDKKVAVVTGASKGIGASIAEYLAKEGAAVVVNYSANKAPADELVRRIQQDDGKAIAVQADVSKQEDITRMLDLATSHFGRLDILVNNAGIYEFVSLEDITEDLFHKHFNLNVLGLLLTTQGAVKRMKNGGSIINIGSIASRSPTVKNTLYTATKAAVDSITVSLSLELGSRGIRVNSINPGMVNTEGFAMSGFLGSEWQKAAEKSTPLGRIAEPGDIARVAVFLASDESNWINGETIFTTGGRR